MEQDTTQTSAHGVPPGEQHTCETKMRVKWIRQRLTAENGPVVLTLACQLICHTDLESALVSPNTHNHIGKMFRNSKIQLMFLAYEMLFFTNLSLIKTPLSFTYGV